MVRLLLSLFLLSSGLLLHAQGIVYPVRVNHKWGYINRYGEIEFAPKYDFIGDGNLPWNVQIPASPAVSSPFKLVELNGKVGLINNDLTEVLPCIYKRIRPLSSQYFAVEIDSLFTVVDTSGKQQMTVRYENICPLNLGKKAAAKYVLVQYNKHWGVHQLNAGLVIPTNYKLLEEAGQGYFRFQGDQDTLWGLLDRNNRQILPTGYSEIRVLGDNFIVAKQPNKHAQILNLKGEVQIINEFKEFSVVKSLNKRLVALHPPDTKTAMLYDLVAMAYIPTKEAYIGFLPLDDHYFVYTVSASYMKGIMDSLGAIVSSPLYFSVDTAGIPYHYIVSRNNYLSGIYVPGKGEITACKYSTIQPFFDHFFLCKSATGWGALDQEFNEVIPCQYNTIGRQENSVIRGFINNNTSVDFYYDAKGKIKGTTRNGQIIQITFDGQTNDAGIIEAIPRTFTGEDDAAHIRVRFPNYIINRDSTLAWNRIEDLYSWDLLRKGTNGKFESVPTKAQYKHVIDLVPQQLMAVYLNRLIKNDFAKLFGESLCRMAFYDMDTQKYVTNLRLLGCREFQEGVPYTAFIDTSGLMGLIGRDGRELLRPDSTPLRYPYIGRFSKGRARVCVGGKIRFTDPGDLEEEKLSLGSQYRFALEFNLKKPQRSIADAEEYNPRSLIVGADKNSQPRWGYLDMQGNLVLDPQYTFVKDFRGDSLAIFVSDDSANVGRYGVLDYTFKPVIPAKYLEISSYFDDFKVAIKNPYLFYFNQKGYQIHQGLPPKRNFSEGLCQVNNGFAWGYIDLNGQIMIPFQFDSTRSFSGGRAAVVDSTREWVFIDTSGTVQFRTGIPAKYSGDFGRFSEGRCRFKKGKLWGYFDAQGKVAIEPKFSRATEFSHGSAVVMILGSGGEKPAIIDTSGNFIKKPGFFDEIFPYNAYGLAVIRSKNGGLFGLINHRGDTIAPVKYTKIEPFQNGYAKVYSATLVGLINLSGREIMRPQFMKIDVVSEGLVAVKKAGVDLWVYVDTTGKAAFPGTYKDVTPFIGGVALVNGRSIINREGQPGLKAFAFGEGVFCMKTEKGNTYFADAAGNNLFGRIFSAAGPFRYGVARAMKNQSWGAVNRRGVFVVPPKFKDVFPQSDGNIHVRPKYLFGLVDKKGKVIFEPKYDLLEKYPGELYRLELGEKVGYSFRDGHWLWELQQ